MVVSADEIVLIGACIYLGWYMKYEPFVGNKAAHRHEKGGPEERHLGDRFMYKVKIFKIGQDAFRKSLITNISIHAGMFEFYES